MDSQGWMTFLTTIFLLAMGGVGLMLYFLRDRSKS